MGDLRSRYCQDDNSVTYNNVYSDYHQDRAALFNKYVWKQTKARVYYAKG